MNMKSVVLKVPLRESVAGSVLGRCTSLGNLFQRRSKGHLSGIDQKLNEMRIYGL